MPLHIVNHPVAAHLLAGLRDHSTPPDVFRGHCRRITQVLAVEATRNLPVLPGEVQTPLEIAPCEHLDGSVILVPIIRAGLGMVDAITQLLPSVKVGYVGMERDEKTAVARAYYAKLPPLDGSHILMLDPMLATGGSAEQTLEYLAGLGADPNKASFICVVAAPEGVARLENRFPGLTVYTASLDRELDENRYIRPGLGDFGDRLYGT